MRDQQAINASMKGKPHPHTGVKATGEARSNISAGMKSSTKIRRLTEKEKRAGNVANVMAYRARQRNAILPTSDLKLIKRIYEACPAGYHVDHKIALARGGAHHQDNLQYLPAQVNRSKNADNPYDESLAIRWQDIIQFPSSSVGRAAH